MEVPPRFLWDGALGVWVGYILFLVFEVLKAIERFERNLLELHDLAIEQLTTTATVPTAVIFTGIGV